ncbi:hypothetical protein OB236_38475 [Paenibacillus sp. WQ 127069]|uniref:Uncharacterized protein n=1 Tax=Paenibacillus baimaensis TaxID=2982185 RepID=A0ABT2UTN4_9BACL|nr:hypothetical protein [Paenibacillus sp. WQ 127069]MCU6798028.1 hypothetical protein [Paenibacillus sp. WQ 127069]
MAKTKKRSMEWTYKQLCQSLAETEYALGKGRSVIRTDVPGGRSDQLKYMEKHYPTQYAEYVEACEVRMTKPVDTKAILATIPV